MFAVTQAPAWAASPPAPALYLALGDSVAAGVGANPPAENGYVSVLHDILTDAPCGAGQALGCRLELRNIASGGATTTTLIDEQLPVAERLLTSRNSNPMPVDDVRLVTIDIGGNDVLSGPVIAACSGGLTPQCLSMIAAQLATVDENYDEILSRLRAAAGPDTTIAVMTYYNPLQACFLSEFVPLADLVLEGAGPTSPGLNDIIRAQAAAHGAVVAETGPVIGPNDLVGGRDCLHPDNSGHQDIADAFAAVIDTKAITTPGRGRPA